MFTNPLQSVQPVPTMTPSIHEEDAMQQSVVYSPSLPTPTPQDNPNQSPQLTSSPAHNESSQPESLSPDNESTQVRRSTRHRQPPARYR